MKKNYRKVMSSIESIINKDQSKPKPSKTGLLSPSSVSSSKETKNNDVMAQVAKYIKAIRDKKKEVVNGR